MSNAYNLLQIQIVSLSQQLTARLDSTTTDKITTKTDFVVCLAGYRSDDDAWMVYAFI